MTTQYNYIIYLFYKVVLVLNSVNYYTNQTKNNNLFYKIVQPGLFILFIFLLFLSNILVLIHLILE